MKTNKLRYNEYYNIQREFDNLYSLSKRNNNFYKLIEIILSEQNIRLAYRKIKNNKGSNTKGTDNLTIESISKLPLSKVISIVRNKLGNYKSRSVKRVMIPKFGSDKLRPLGIPTIWDRLIQQCILQVLEPICEAKFHNHSYGFRPNRSPHHAISRMVSLINISRYHYCVDVDIKGFFDNVNHNKLMSQLWTLGIRDKRLLCIIKKILRSEIKGIGIPDKGTPQGGIISPLLANVVLNELDWWISSQWETFIPRNYKNPKSFHYTANRSTNLKSGYIVRYADDFKIMCRSYEEAQRYYHAVKDFITTRLKLEINEEKSGVSNLKSNSTDFLGFRIKVQERGKTKHGYVAITNICNKALIKIENNVKNKILEIKTNQNKKSLKNHNVVVIGIKNYYQIATNIYNNLHKIDYKLTCSYKNKLGNIAEIIKFRDVDKKYQKYMVGIRNNKGIYQLHGICLIPLRAVKHKNPMNFKQIISNYTEEGRNIIHEELKCINTDTLIKVSNMKFHNRSIEYHDNFISKFVGQYGKCYITRKLLNMNNLVCHNIIPQNKGGTDKYNNLVIINKNIAPLLYMDKNKFENYSKIFKFNTTEKSKLNKLRQNIFSKTVEN